MVIPIPMPTTEYIHINNKLSKQKSISFLLHKMEQSHKILNKHSSTGTLLYAKETKIPNVLL